jgi:hypothetical protein
VRYERQLGVAGRDRTDTSGDPAKRLKPRGVGFDGLAARAIDVLDEQQSSLVVGTGGDDARRWDTPARASAIPRTSSFCVRAVSGVPTRNKALPSPSEAS